MELALRRPAPLISVYRVAWHTLAGYPGICPEKAVHRASWRNLSLAILAVAGSFLGFTGPVTWTTLIWATRRTGFAKGGFGVLRSFACSSAFFAGGTFAISSAAAASGPFSS